MTLLESAIRLIYQEWFVRLRFPRHEASEIVRGVPTGWMRRPIGEIADCSGGGTPPTSVRNYWDDGDITWVTPTDVTNNKAIVLLDSEKKITADGLQNSSSKIVPDHAILMTSRASIGFFALAGRPVCTNQGFISIASHDPSLAPYLLFHLIARVEEIRALGAGSTFPEVSRGKFRNFNIIVPSSNLTSSFSASATTALSEIRILKLQNQKLRTARDLLLPRLMSGEILP
jgi:type I restriction enzyme S subunit